jgi:hypothetical protein
MAFLLHRQGVLLSPPDPNVGPGKRGSITAESWGRERPQILAIWRASIQEIGAVVPELVSDGACPRRRVGLN